MTYKYNIINPMHMVERRLKMIIARNLQLINALVRRFSHQLSRKYPHIPFNN